MKITINLDAIGESVDFLIKEKLKKLNLPTCLGNMSPPLISNMLDIEDMSLFCEGDIIPPENIVMNNISFLIEDTHILKSDYIKDLVLDINGKNKIEAFKERLSTDYVNKLLKCTTCDYKELCNQLTTHYLKTIFLKEFL